MPRIKSLNPVDVKMFPVIVARPLVSTGHRDAQKCRAMCPVRESRHSRVSLKMFRASLDAGRVKLSRNEVPYVLIIYGISSNSNNAIM